jgi:UDP-GlcNAc:undecaprenyl-phosphate GlcNAc-1-phosphate transferase
LIGLIGLWDDVKNLRPFPRFVAQSVGGVFTASLIVSTNTIGSPTGNNALDFFITVFWIVGVTNSVNFFDNLDGGASGTVAISSLGLFALAVTSGQFYVATLSLVLAGSAFGFLFWNRNPAQIYMGDAGALFLGMLLASLLVRFDPNPINLYAGFAIPIMIMAIPILDTSVAVISRIQRKKSPFEGGQDHLSHRLIRRNLGRKKTALVLWFLTALFVALAIILSNSPYRLEGVVLIAATLIWTSLFAWFYRQSPN